MVNATLCFISHPKVWAMLMLSTAYMLGNKHSLVTSNFTPVASIAKLPKASISSSWIVAKAPTAGTGAAVTFRLAPGATGTPGSTRNISGLFATVVDCKLELTWTRYGPTCTDHTNLYRSSN